MMSTINDLCSVIVDCEHKTSPEDDSGKYFAVGTPAMRGNVIDYSEARRISHETFVAWTRRLEPKFGDLLFAREAPVGPIVRIPVEENIAPGQRTVLMRPNPALVDSRYLYYRLSSSLEQERLQAMAGGSTVAHLNVADIRAFRLGVPSLLEQRAIAEVLGALDDKIAANMRVKKAALQLAASTYQGALMSGPTRKVELRSVAQNVPGKYLSKDKYVSHGVYLVFGSNSVMGRHDTSLVPGAIAVLAKIGSYCGNLRWSERPSWVNNNASAIVPNAFISPWILRHALDRLDMGPHRAGTGQPYIRMESLFSAAVELPSSELSDSIASLLENLSMIEVLAEEENRTLAATRDALLPQLMSGKLRVRDAETAVEAVV